MLRMSPQFPSLVSETFGPPFLPVLCQKGLTRLRERRDRLRSRNGVLCDYVQFEREPHPVTELLFFGFSSFFFLPFFFLPLLLHAVFSSSRAHALCPFRSRETSQLSFFLKNERPLRFFSFPRLGAAPKTHPTVLPPLPCDTKISIREALLTPRAPRPLFANVRGKPRALDLSKASPRIKGPFPLCVCPYQG